MSRNIYSILILFICAFSPNRVQSQDVADPNNDFEKVPMISLTNLDVNDTNLKLSYKIKNNTDHNVWICDDVIYASQYNSKIVPGYSGEGSGAYRYI